MSARRPRRAPDIGANSTRLAARHPTVPGTAAAMRARTLALAGAAGAASAVGIALSRLKRPGAAERRSPQADAYRCACGQEFRLAGTGRHRVYWLKDAAEGDPLLTLRCPACERPLPGTRDAAGGVGGPAPASA
jgi:hypothetical protein